MINNTLVKWEGKAKVDNGKWNLLSLLNFAVADLPVIPAVLPQEATSNYKI